MLCISVSHVRQVLGLVDKDHLLLSSLTLEQLDFLSCIPYSSLSYEQGAVSLTLGGLSLHQTVPGSRDACIFGVLVEEGMPLWACRRSCVVVMGCDIWGR